MNQRKRKFLLNLTINVMRSIDPNEPELISLQEVIVNHDKIKKVEEIYDVKFWDEYSEDDQDIDEWEWEKEGHQKKWVETLDLIENEIVGILKEIRDQTPKKPKKRNYFFIFILGIILGLISLVAINYHLPAKKMPENVKINPQIVDKFGNRAPIVEIPEKPLKELKTDDLK